MSKPKRILVAPLDWGLGHASRCIPVIREIIALGHQPILASDGGALDLLKKEFPAETAIRLPGYHPVYPQDDGMVMKMALQTPKFLTAITREHLLLKSIIREHAIDLVISDNRYGLGTNKKPSVLITHQLFIQMPQKMKWMEPGVNRLNHFFIRRFQQCWVPDVQGENNLSGNLSHGAKIPPNVKFVGMLSRFSPAPAEKEYDLLVLLSGPEPQRTILEQKIISQIKTLSLRTLVVRGVTSENERTHLAETVEAISHLTSKELNQRLLQSGAVICRPGYSSVMELASLQKAALLIPTPGQTEQEYLARRLSKNGYFITQSQESLDVPEGILKLKQLKKQEIPFEGELFKKALKSFAETTLVNPPISERQLSRN